MSTSPIPDTLLEQLEAVAHRENRSLVSLITEMLAHYQSSVTADARLPFLTIEDLGWTPEQAAAVRAQFAAFAEDWDDPAMDVYDEL